MNTSVDIINSPTYDFIPYIGASIDYLFSNFPVLVRVIQVIIGYLVGLSIPVIVVCFFGIIYCVEKLKRIRAKEAEVYDAVIEMGYTNATPVKNTASPETVGKWKMVLQHVESQNPNDWRQAVMEADVILGSLLTKLGYQGQGIGEQLKRATKADFATLDDAWNAHKVRNELAHAGSDFQFSQFDARRVIQQYRKVFEEFTFI